MKNLFTLCTLLAFIVTLTCCSKSNDATPNSVSTGSVTFKEDSTTTFKSTLSQGVWDPTNSLLNVVAKGGKSIFVMSVIMPSGLQKGTYNFSATATTGTNVFYRADTTKINEGYYSNIDSKSFGTLVISNVSADSLVTGTFTFTLKDPISGKIKKLTSGVITDVKAVNTGSLTSTGTNTFSAKIDGAAWNPNLISAISFGGNIVISVTDGVKSIGINLPVTTKAGTYTMDLGGDYSGQYSPSNSITSPIVLIASAATSKLTIAEHNTTAKTVKGSFNFKGQDLLGGTSKIALITEGVFNVKY